MKSIHVGGRVLALSLFCLAVAGQPSQAQVRSYTVTTFAGDGTGAFLGDSGQALSAELNQPCALALDSSGNLYLSDQVNYRVRRIGTDGVITTIAGNGTAGNTGDGKAATSAEIQTACGLAVDSSGNVYISDSSNNVVRKISGGNISTFAGNGNLGFAGDTGLATSAELYGPEGLAFDSAGNLYIADSKNNVVRKVAAADGTISTLVGTGTAGDGGDGGPANLATLYNPQSLLLDAAGNLYIADTNNNKVRILTTDGNINTFAGNGTGGYSGDGGPATKASLNYPKGLALDSAGILYFVDGFNHRVRAVLPGGTIITIAGTGAAGYADGAGNQAMFKFPSGLALSSNGKLYVADAQNNRIRLLTPSSQLLPAINANGVVSASGFGGFPSIAPGTWIEIKGTNLASTTRTWTTADFTGIRAPTSLEGTRVSIGGQAAFVDYISPTQVNAQVPSGVPTGTEQITVSNAAGTSAEYPITVNLTQPGLLAPASFLINGKQYVVALFTDFATFVAPSGAISGYASRPAKPGETIVLFGIGFGQVTQNIQAGIIVPQANSLLSPLQILFGQTPAAPPAYAGLAPGAVGLYQFNVVVPNVPAGDAVPLSFVLAGTNGTQTLYTAVGN